MNIYNSIIIIIPNNNEFILNLIMKWAVYDVYP